MPAWDEYKAAAKERGSLAFELYVVESTPAKSPDDLKANLPNHLAYQAKLEADGRLFLAGPMSDPTGEQMLGTGLIIYRASSMEDARKIAEGDPMHSTGTRTFVLRKWMINEGSLSLSLSLSHQKIAVS